MSTLTILHRNMKWRFHNALTIVITILQPLLWLTLYGTAAGQAMKGSGTDNYTAFILPGLIVLTGFSACSSSGIMNYSMKKTGSFYRVLAAPVSRGSIVLGHILEAVLCTLLEAGIMTAAGLLLSVQTAAGPSGIATAILLLLPAAFFMAGLSFSVSLLLPDEALYETVMNAVVLPVFFLSGALFPTVRLHGVLRIAVRINPFTYMTGALRKLVLYGAIETAELLFTALLFIIMGAAVFVWALHRLEKETDL